MADEKRFEKPTHPGRFFPVGAAVIAAASVAISRFASLVRSEHISGPFWAASAARYRCTTERARSVSELDPPQALSMSDSAPSVAIPLSTRVIVFGQRGARPASRQGRP